MKVAISDIIADRSINVRDRLDDEWIERCADSFEYLPPVVVYKAPEGLLLSEGFHRFEAAKELGLNEIEAEVREGTRADAEEYAAIANARAQLPLTKDELRKAIRRLKQLHQDWGEKKIADTLGCGEHAVSMVFAADKVKQEVGPVAEQLRPTHLEELSRAPREEWKPLAETAVEKGWTHREVRAAAQRMKDETVPLEYKERLKRGEEEPVVFKEGRPAVLPETMRRAAREERQRDVQVPLYTFTYTLMNQFETLRKFTPEEIVRPLKVEQLEALERDLPLLITFLGELLNQVRQKLYASGGLR